MKNQNSKFSVGAQAQVNNLSDAMFLAELAAEAEQEAINEEFFLSELAAEAPDFVNDSPTLTSAPSLIV